VRETENLFFSGPGTISTIERRSPYRSYHTGGHGISRHHSATAGSTIPIYGAGVLHGRGRNIWYEWLILVDILADPSTSCIGSSADDGSHMSQY
jgi:hypothetical protein